MRVAYHSFGGSSPKGRLAERRGTVRWLASYDRYVPPQGSNSQRAYDSRRCAYLPEQCT